MVVVNKTNVIFTMTDKTADKSKKRSAYKTSTKQKQNERWDKIRDDYPWRPGVDYREHPDEYRVGKGEQGVLTCEPYKSEICQHWRFRTPDIARESSEKIYAMFIEYVKAKDFVGADMARKFIQMGYTRARRYANHNTGRKYDKKTGEELPPTPPNPDKIESARIFYDVWKKAEANVDYIAMKADWKQRLG